MSSPSTSIPSLHTIDHARIFTGGRFVPGSIRIRDGRIEAVIPEETHNTYDIPDPNGRLDAQGCLVIPGLIDLHFHGCMGADFCDGTEEALHTIASYELQAGVTSICPAMLTLPADSLKKTLALAAEHARSQQDLTVSASASYDRAAQTPPASAQATADSFYGPEAMEADLVGVNMEGPFISHVKKGAQNEKYILPCDAGLCREFYEASGGLLKIIGLAPEESPDFEEYIRQVSQFVKVSLAHTNADYDTARRAFEAGAGHVVHLFNAMPELMHRAPGVVGAALDSPGVFVELICDGNHMHHSLTRAAYRMFESRVVMISDSLRATGLGDGEMDLGGQKVIVRGRLAALAEGGAMAGSVSNLMQCLQTAVLQIGIPLETAVESATYAPARALGIENSRGRIAPGCLADLVMLDDQLNVVSVIKSGRIVRR